MSCPNMIEGFATGNRQSENVPHPTTKSAASRSATLLSACLACISPGEFGQALFSK